MSKPYILNCQLPDGKWRYFAGDESEVRWIVNREEATCFDYGEVDAIRSSIYWKANLNSSFIDSQKATFVIDMGTRRMNGYIVKQVGGVWTLHATPI